MYYLKVYDHKDIDIISQENETSLYPDYESFEYLGDLIQACQSYEIDPYIVRDKLGFIGIFRIDDLKKGV